MLRSWELESEIVERSESEILAMSELGILERLESDILPLIVQPWLQVWLTADMWRMTDRCRM